MNIFVYYTQGEGVMMSYTSQSKQSQQRTELASVVTGGAIPAGAAATSTEASETK